MLSEILFTIQIVWVNHS